MQTVQPVSAGAPLRPLGLDEVMVRLRAESSDGANRRLREERGEAPPTVPIVQKRYRLSVSEVLDIRRRFRHTAEPASAIAEAYDIPVEAVREIGRAIAFDDRANGYA